MENKTQIKFKDPEADGTPIPVIISLEKETPLEGESVRDNGEKFVWHRWLCKNEEYFLASGTLDAMLKIIPNKINMKISIKKVPNENENGFPYFHVNGMTKDQLIVKYGRNNTQPDAFEAALMPPTANSVDVPASSLPWDTIISKLDEISKKLDKSEDENIPF